MTRSFKYDIFISHSSIDKFYARELATKLRDMGLKIWFDEWVIRAGDDIYLALEQGLSESQILLLCMTPDFFNSDWTGLERSTAIFRDPRNKEQRFIPLLLKPCEIPGALQRYKYIDLQKQHNTENAISEIFSFFSDGNAEAAEENRDYVAAVVDDNKDYLKKKTIYNDIDRLRRQSLLKGVPGSILFLDIDRFDHINKTYGNIVGDKVLETVEKLLCNISGISYCERWGGDEFICFFEKCSENMAINNARVARNAISGFSWHTTAPNLFVTASFGVAYDDYCQSTDVIVERAMLGSRNGKREGGNQVCLSPLVGLPRAKKYTDPVEYLCFSSSG